MSEQANPELTLTRVFNAPRELVWKAWTDPEMLAKWWGPRGFTNPVCEIDVRIGGKINIVMEDTEGLIEKGGQYPMTGTFTEIDEPQKLVFTSVAMQDGKPLFENTNTIILEEEAGQTILTMHAVVATIYDAEASKAPLAGMEAGWSQSLDKLAQLF